MPISAARRTGLAAGLALTAVTFAACSRGAAPLPSTIWASSESGTLEVLADTPLVAEAPGDPPIPGTSAVWALSKSGAEARAEIAILVTRRLPDAGQSPRSMDSRTNSTLYVPTDRTHTVEKRKWIECREVPLE